MAAALLAAVVVTAGVRATVVTTVVVPGTSMRPTVQPGDHLVVWRLGRVSRGDVVVVDGTGSFDALEPDAPGTLLGRPTLYVKRVVGGPGDRVACCDVDGRLVVDGTPLAEPYLAAGVEPSTTRFDVAVPPGRLWLMGDDRGTSTDSRALLGAPGGGAVAEERVVGRVVAVAWPPDRWRGVQAPAARAGAARSMPEGDPLRTLPVEGLP